MGGKKGIERKEGLKEEASGRERMQKTGERMRWKLIFRDHCIIASSEDKIGEISGHRWWRNMNIRKQVHSLSVHHRITKARR